MCGADEEACSNVSQDVVGIDNDDDNNDDDDVDYYYYYYYYYVDRSI